ncbi:hypothetical protein [Streptomyces sp. NPDC058989]|uniref:hypothetical protein n=1 Tax=Streptomyces sp. NPDC058989 TaxID=3346686 RepID=UPI003675E625
MVIASVLAVFASLGSDDGGEPSPTPSTPPSVSSSAAARELAKRVTLTAKDWGSSFVSDPPDETSLSWMAPDKDCQSVMAPKGFDDLMAEQGHDIGGGLDSYYTSLTASKGQFVLQSYVSRPGAKTQGRNLNEAVKALSLMLSRLESG